MSQIETFTPEEQRKIKERVERGLSRFLLLDRKALQKETLNKRTYIPGLIVPIVSGMAVATTVATAVMAFAAPVLSIPAAIAAGAGTVLMKKAGYSLEKTRYASDVILGNVDKAKKHAMQSYNGGFKKAMGGVLLAMMGAAFVTYPLPLVAAISAVVAVAGGAYASLTTGRDTLVADVVYTAFAAEDCAKERICGARAHKVIPTQEVVRGGVEASVSPDWQKSAPRSLPSMLTLQKPKAPDIK